LFKKIYILEKITKKNFYQQEMESSIIFEEFIDKTKEPANQLALIEFSHNLSLISKKFECKKCSSKMKLSVRID